MFIRELKNRSGSISIQIISKYKGTYKLIKTVGCATDVREIERLKDQAREQMYELSGCSNSLFPCEKDEIVEKTMQSLSNSSIRTVGPELVFGRIYDFIGFGSIKEELFRHLVISRLSFPLSKLKTVDYLYRYQGVLLDIDKIYRFLDRLNDSLKSSIEQIAFTHTKEKLGCNVSVVFYDMTTLYFESSDEDDLRKTGFSKDGKHQCPQIMIGLLVGLDGYLLGYDIYQGNTYEGDTLLPFIKNISNRFSLGKPIIIADSGLLSKKNIIALEQYGYQYIIGARIKNETKEIKSQILSQTYQDGQIVCFDKGNARRLLVSYSDKRAIKDLYNRHRGLKRLEKRIRTGKLTKNNINNRGYNKYLKLEGEVKVSIDNEMFEQDASWDGLKGYITNTNLSNECIINNYKNLWHIERAFRMSKTDLRIRPVFHHLRKRIEAHICIAFTAYCIYKELEMALYASKSRLSLKTAAEITHNMYQITYQLPQSKHTKTQLLKMDEKQNELLDIINKNFRVLQR
jgi:transposase